MSKDNILIMDKEVLFAESVRDCQPGEEEEILKILQEENRKRKKRKNNFKNKKNR